MAAAAPPAGSPGKPSRQRLAPGQLLEDVQAALARILEVFDCHDLLRALGYGYEPERSSLHRVLASLVNEGVLVLEAYGAGKIPAKYKKAGS